MIEHGEDFQQAREHAAALAGSLGLHMVPSFHPDLVRGVATYWIEFFEQVQPDFVLVPIGQGSGICACAAARAYSGAATRIVGVVSAHATAYRDSFAAGRVVEAPVSTQLADGMACRVPDADALAIMLSEVDRDPGRQRRRGGRGHAHVLQRHAQRRRRRRRRAAGGSAAAAPSFLPAAAWGWR